MKLHEVVDKDKQPLFLNGIAQRYYGVFYAKVAVDNANKLFPERAPFSYRETTE